MLRTLLLSGLLIPYVSAIKVTFTAKQPLPLLRSVGGNKDAFNFSNVNNIRANDIYTADLDVGGHNFSVQVDTGSSDLWLDTANVNFQNVQNTNIQAGITYGDGTSAQGPVMIGNVTFGDFAVPQAFISAPGSNATTNNDNGLLGVGPPALSAINNALAGSGFNGKSLLENVFAANTSTPHLITFQLSRSLATGTTDGGVFTVGEVDTTLSAISTAPQLPVVNKQRWVVLMDGIIVNGKNVTGRSDFTLDGQGPGQTLANLDTGTGLAQIPQFYLDAIYGSVPGAQFDANQGVYFLPCDTQINLSFVFGGIAYPIHPIDTVTASATTRGGVVCFSGFPGSSGESDSEDFLLGDSFLRNVYSLYDFGSFINGTASPFIQLLSTTDATKAAAEFNSLTAQRNASITGKNGNGNGPRSGAERSTGLPALFLSLVGLGIGLIMR